MMPQVSIVNVLAAILSFSTVCRPVYIYRLPQPTYNTLASATLPLVTPIAKVFHVTIVLSREGLLRLMEALILLFLVSRKYPTCPDQPQAQGVRVWELSSLGSKLETNAFLN